jgi:hypothetical protein
MLVQAVPGTAREQWKLQEPQVELRDVAGRLRGAKNGASSEELAVAGCWKSGQAGSLAFWPRTTAGPATRRQRTVRSMRDLCFFMASFLSGAVDGSASRKKYGQL